MGNDVREYRRFAWWRIFGVAIAIYMVILQWLVFQHDQHLTLGLIVVFAFGVMLAGLGSKKIVNRAKRVVSISFGVFGRYLEEREDTVQFESAYLDPNENITKRSDDRVLYSVGVIQSDVYKSHVLVATQWTTRSGKPEELYDLLTWLGCSVKLEGDLVSRGTESFESDLPGLEIIESYYT